MPAPPGPDVEPPRRRTGARPADLDPALRAALAAEGERLRGLAEPASVVREVSNFFAALDPVLQSEVAAARLDAVDELRFQGWSYERIAEGTGLSKERVAQLAREARQRR